MFDNEEIFLQNFNANFTKQQNKLRRTYNKIVCIILIKFNNIFTATRIVIIRSILNLYEGKMLFANIHIRLL